MTISVNTEEYPKEEGRGREGVGCHDEEDERLRQKFVNMGEKEHVCKHGATTPVAGSASTDRVST